MSVSVTSGTKANYKTGIKINRIDSSDNSLISIGENIVGTINYDLKTAYDDFTTPVIKASTATVKTSSTNQEMGGSGLTSSSPWIVFNWQQNSGAWYNYTANYPGYSSAYNRIESSWGNYTTAVNESGSYYYYCYIGAGPNFYNEHLRNIIGSSGLAVSVPLSTDATTSTKTVSATTQSAASHQKSSLINDSASVLNLSVAGENASIQKFACWR